MNTKPELYIFDIETIPQDEESLTAVMPESIANPRMPEELEKPVFPDFSEKCPDYGLTDAIAKVSLLPMGGMTEKEKKQSIAASAKVEAIEQRRAAWIADATETAKRKHKAAIAEWRGKCMDDRLKFIDQAALRAETALVPLIGVLCPVCTSFFFVATKEEAAAINRAKIDEAASGAHLFAFETEGEMLTAFWSFVKSVFHESLNAKFAGFHSNRFDLPMLKRRSWCNGVPIPVATMSGAYADRNNWLCLHEEWQSGDREVKVGLNSVARALGVPLKDGDGENFWQLWQTDKTAALLYNLADLIATRGIADKMGF